MPTEIARGLSVETVGDILENIGSAPPSADGARSDLPHDPTGDISDNERVRLGGNMPPEELQPEKTPYEVHKEAIEDLYQEAKNWLDGEPIENHDQAAAVGKLRGLIQEAKTAAEAQRVVEKKPHDDAAKEVQARYNPLIKDKTGLADVAISVLNQALKPFMDKIAEEQRKQAAVAAQQARDAAEKARNLALEAAKAPDLEKREEAEAAIQEAKDIAKTAAQLDKAKPQVGGLTRNIGMKSVYTANLVDPKAALAHYRQTRPGALKEWLKEQARLDVVAGAKFEDAIPGFKIKEDRVPV